VSGRRAVVALLAMMLAAAVVGGLLSSPPASADAADPAPPGSAVTVSGTGDFKNLQVTVSQTKNLINQTVKVSWIGGTPTLSSTTFFVNYLQIMQCWGDDQAGPDRTQCQFGASEAGNAPGYVGLRQVGASPVDPEEKVKLPAGSSGGAYVPFWAAGRDKPAPLGVSNGNDFFDSQITNEIAFGRTHGDGSGEEFFEVETVRQAAGLGCGEPVITGGSTSGRSCWLVIVPRGTKEVDGSIRNGLSSSTNTGLLLSSPLSQSNWDHRIVVPLEFQPVGQACPIGAPERHLIGHELVVDAVSSWQSALCAGGGTLFSYTQLPDEVARSQVQDGRLAVVTDPIPPDQVPADHPLVYAPVGLSGLTIAFNINNQPDYQHKSAAADLERSGRRFTTMKLTPRLVAKLLTQSYQKTLENAVEVLPDELKNNPPGLLFDPDFLAINHEYQGFVDLGSSAPDALVQINGADLTSQLWSWVIADPNARAFLAGTPDEFGMRVNHNNQNLPLPTSTFPRNDQSCKDTLDPAHDNVTLKTCNLDLHPFAKDMHDAGRSASRGDTQGKVPSVSGGGQILPTSVPRQGAGHQGLLAIVDAATANRYGLPTAQLLNVAGNYVAPTPESLLAGAAAMKPSAVAGVMAADPGTRDPHAYPLTALSYAVTSPSTLDAATGKDYAAFLRYAGGPGQQQGLTPGLLPFGMVPLPDLLKAQTIAAAAAIEAQITQTLTSPPAPPPTTTGVPRGPSTAAGPGEPKTASGTPAPLPSVPPVAAQIPAASGAKAPSVVAQQPVAGVRRTPSLPGPWWVGGLLLVVLIASGLAATSSPVIQTLGGGLRRRLRKGVRPTEQ
jgi:hypothetical protein